MKQVLRLTWKIKREVDGLPAFFCYRYSPPIMWMGAFILGVWKLFQIVFIIIKFDNTLLTMNMKIFILDIRNMNCCQFT